MAQNTPLQSITLSLTQPPYGFTAISDFIVETRFDNSVPDGGANYGARPMQSLLMALASCSGIDILDIMRKKREELTGYSVTVEGRRQEGGVPSLWETIHMRFTLTGPFEPEHAKQAIALSVDKYCSVAETLRRAGCTITWELTE